MKITKKQKPTLKSNLRSVINKYKETEAIAQKSAYRDAITDIMHLCKERGIDFDYLVESAREVYQEEIL